MASDGGDYGVTADDLLVGEILQDLRRAPARPRGLIAAATTVRAGRTRP